MPELVSQPANAGARSRVGIVGGGQLGWMLCMAARGLGLETVVLSADADCPAAAAADRVIAGGLDDVDAARRLAADVDVVTFEIESVAPEVLRRLQAEVETGEVAVWPAPGVLLLLQNKMHQKQWLVRHGFPTAEFETLPGGPVDVGAAAARLGLPLVQKAAVGGYDGRGVQILRDAASLSGLWPVAGVLEAFVPHEVELAVVTARAAAGHVVSYPPVAMRFRGEANILDTVISPAPVAESVARRAEQLAHRIVEQLDGVGVFAVEMFATESGEVLVNEISPRVHNAGHLTAEACATSQFEQHLRAVTGMPLGSAAQARPAVMKNVLYCEGLAHWCARPPGRELGDGGSVAVYWYGKRRGTPLRKMGHVTALADDVATAERLAADALEGMARTNAEGGR